MADFALLIAAAEPALPWSPGRFAEAYELNRADADELALESAPVAGVLRKWIQANIDWEGTATALLEVLTEEAGDLAKRKEWPSQANKLSGMLRRLAPNLRAVGYSCGL